MERIKSFKWIIISSILLVCVVSGILFYSNYLKRKAYDYKGIFVMNSVIRSDRNGCIYKDC